MALTENPAPTTTVNTAMYGVCTLTRTLGGRFYWTKADGGRVSLYYTTAEEAQSLVRRLGL